MKIPKFSIYYADGSRVDGGGDDDEVVYLAFSRKWLEAPSDGVQAVVTEDSWFNRVVTKALDFFYQMPLNGHGEGSNGAANSLGPYVRQLGIVKVGGWTASENYQEIVNRAFGDADHVPGNAVSPPRLDHDSAED